MYKKAWKPEAAPPVMAMEFQRRAAVFSMLQQWRGWDAVHQNEIYQAGGASPSVHQGEPLRGRRPAPGIHEAARTRVRRPPGLSETPDLLEEEMTDPRYFENRGAGQFQDRIEAALRREAELSDPRYLDEIQAGRDAQGEEGDE